MQATKLLAGVQADRIFMPFAEDSKEPVLQKEG
jgi:hypothetical protein